MITQSCRFFVISITAFAMGVGSSVSVADVLIDDFVSDTAGGDTIFLTGPGSTSTIFTASSAIGGTRDVFFEHDYPASSSLVFRETPALVSGLPISLAISNPAPNDLAQDSSWSITYDASGSGLGLDLLTAGDQIVLEWVPDHVAMGNDTVIGFTLTDGSAVTHSASVVWSSPADTFVNSDWDVFSTSFLLSDFSAQGVDLTDISSIVFFGETDVAGDYEFSRIMVTNALEPPDVPEPTSLLLCGLGALLLTLLSRSPSNRARFNAG